MVRFFSSQAEFRIRMCNAPKPDQFQDATARPPTEQLINYSHLSRAYLYPVSLFHSSWLVAKIPSCEPRARTFCRLIGLGKCGMGWGYTPSWLTDAWSGPSTPSRPPSCRVIQCPKSYCFTAMLDILYPPLFHKVRQNNHVKHQQ